MHKIYIAVCLLILSWGCSKKEDSSPFWEKSLGSGKAIAIEMAADSGFLTCGQLNNSPVFIKLDKSGKKVIEYKSESIGLFGSLIQNSDDYFLGGNSSGKMLLSRIDSAGIRVWEKEVTSQFAVYNTTLLKTSPVTFLGIGSANADSATNRSSGLLFVWFDTTGTIIKQQTINGELFLTASEAVADNASNLYLAFTRKATGSESKASVAKWSPALQKYWETELYNNPEFGAASIGIARDNSGNIYVTGHTETPSDATPLSNSFLVKLDNSGIVKWKKYLEGSNSGVKVVFNDEGNLVLLNKNCFLITVLASSDGSKLSVIRVFNACDSYNTDSFGSDIIIHDNKYILAGSKGGSYYIAVKPGL